MKRIAGDDGKCWMSEGNLAKRCGVSRNRLRKSIKYLLEHGWVKLDGDRTTGGGEQKTNSYLMVDLWGINNDFYQKNQCTSKEQRKGSVHVVNTDLCAKSTDQCAPKEHKEYPLNNITINKNQSSLEYLKNIPKDDLKELSIKYRVPEKFIWARSEDVIDYCEAKGKVYKNYKAALRNFIKSHLERHPDERMRPVVATTAPITNDKPRTPEEQRIITKRLAEMRSQLSTKLAM